MSRKSPRTRHIPSRRESKRSQVKTAAKQKPKAAAPWHAVQMIVFLGLLVVAGLFGVSTSIAKRTHVFTGSITALDSSARSIQVRCPEGGEVLSFKFSSDTAFIAPGVQGNPDSSWVGKDVEVQFRKSLLFNDTAERVAAKETSRAAVLESVAHTPH